MKSRSIIAGAAALLMAFSCTGTALNGNVALFSASAAGTVDVSGTWEYTKVDGGVKLMKALRLYDETFVDVPTEIDGQKVVEISAHFIDDFHELWSVFIRDETVKFDGNLFEYSKIGMVEFPEYSVNRAFVDGNTVSISYPLMTVDPDDHYYNDDRIIRYQEKYCDYVNGEYIPKKVDVKVPATAAGAEVTELEPNAFSGSKVINKVTLPDTIRVLYSNCFSESTLTSVNIPEKVRFIPDFCFYSCKSLEKIEIPDSVIGVSVSAFLDTKFYDSKADPDNEVYGYGNWIVCRNKEWKALHCFNSDYSISVMPFEYTGSDTVVDYPSEFNGFPVADLTEQMELFGINEGSSAISDSGVTEIRFPDDLTFMPNLSNSNITKIDIPSGVTEIAAGQFRNCSKLTSVTLPPNVKEVRGFAFADCENLTELNIEGDSIVLDWQAFDNTGLTSVELPGNCVVNDEAFGKTLESVSFRAGDKVLLNYNAFNCLPALKNVSFSPDIKDIIINDRAFYATGLEEIVLGSNVKDISHSAFKNCISLKSVEISGSSRIGGEAFMDDINLEKVVLNGAHKIDDNAFKGCISLENLDIDTDCTVSHSAFNGCEELYRINNTEVIGRNTRSIAPSLDSFVRISFDGAEDIGFVNRLIRNYVTAVVKEVTNNDMTDIEKAKALHDWICENTVYAEENLNDPGNHADSSVFMNGIAVCEGYSRTYNLLLREAGLKSWFVSNSTHSWNVVMINGKPYHIDTTWDDTESSTNWFMRTDMELTKAGGDHYTWQAVIPSDLHSFQDKELPECTGMMGDIDNDGDIDTADVGSIRSRILNGEKYDLRTDLDFNGKLSAGDLAAAIIRLDSPGLKMGDVDRDGLITSADASMLLEQYAKMSVSEGRSFSSRDYLICDVNVDGQINAVDASAILGYYTYISTGGTDNIASYTENQ